MRSARYLARDLVEHAVQFHVLVGGLLAVQAGVLENDPELFPGFILVDCGIEAVQFNRSAGGIQQGGEHLDGGGFAGAVGTEKGKDLARCDVERNVVDGGKVAELLDQVLYLDHDRPG